MQLMEALPGNTPVLIPVLSVVNPVLPLISIPKITTVKPHPAKSGRVAARKESIPVSPVCEPVPDTTRKPVAPPMLARPHSATVSRRISRSNPFVEQDIPLYLVPHIIARAIWQR